MKAPFYSGFGRSLVRTFLVLILGLSQSQILAKNRVKKSYKSTKASMQPSCTFYVHVYMSSRVVWDCSSSKRVVNSI